MKFKKIDKKFVLSDSTVNSYGFRLLTSGYNLSAFAKNPIGYYMHDREAGVLLKWEDVKVEGDQITGYPVINLSHARGQQTIDEIENGFLNAASMGHFVVEKMTDDESFKLPGQFGPTVTKWSNRECSLVDVPGNFNALKLYDKEGEEINLADFQKKSSSMKKVILSAGALAALKLSAEADETAVDTVINDLLAKAAKVDQLTNELSAANTAKTNAENALATAKKEAVQKEVKDLLSAALEGKKITKEVSDKLAATYAENPSGLKDLLAVMPAYQSITEAIKTGSTGAKELADLTFDELDKQGKLEDLRAKDPETFKAKFKAKFGVDYKS